MNINIASFAVDRYFQDTAFGFKGCREKDFIIGFVHIADGPEDVCFPAFQVGTPAFFSQES
jgi:hypothetical protein